MTSWTLHDPMFHDLRGHCSFPSTIILGFALLAWLFLLSSRLFHIGFDERWRRRFLFFHLFDPSQSDTKPFLRLFQCLTQFLVLFSQLGRFFFCHDPSLSERSSLNSYPKGSAKKPGLQNRRETPTVKGNEIVLTHRRRSLSCRYKYRSPSRLRQVPVWPRWNT